MNEGSHTDLDIASTAAFPLPFRVLFLIGVGILGWATNLHGLDVLGVDTVTAMDLRTDEGYLPRSIPSARLGGFKLLSESTNYAPIYRLFTTYSVWSFFSWAFFRYATYGNVQLVDLFAYIPAISALFVLAVLISPFDICQKRERDMFLLAIRRCLFSPMDRPVYFSDVVFADIFTSFAKVLGDVWLSLCMLLPGGSLLVTPPQDGWSRWIFPAIMSMPYLVRLRQCVVEYGLPSNESRRPLFNALKYATSFPVIFLSAAQRIVVSELVKEKGEKAAEDAWHGEHRLFRLWLLAAAVNSLYSFWWDVTNDWGLNLLKVNSTEGIHRPASPPRRLLLPTLRAGSPPSSRSSLSLHTPPLSNDLKPGAWPNDGHSIYPWGLRPTLLYPLPVYPLLVFLNLVLRLTWSIKLSTHLHQESDGSVAIFWLEVAEIVRRWMWVFLRVEWEVIKQKEGGLRSRLDHSSGDDEDYELIRSIPYSDDLVDSS